MQVAFKATYLLVFKEDSAAKMRIVYDASAKTSNNISSLSYSLHADACLRL